jgi:putative superfamily III holin-X
MNEKENYFRETKQRVSQYIQNRILLLRLQATDKASNIAATIITIVIIVLIGLFLLIFASITLGCWLAELTGSLTAGFGIVALFYLVVLLAVIFFLRKMLSNFFISKFINLIHKKD